MVEVAAAEEDEGAGVAGPAVRGDCCMVGWRDRSSLNTEFIWRLIIS